jgi:hypothetical protein
MPFLREIVDIAGLIHIDKPINSELLKVLYPDGKFSFFHFSSASSIVPHDHINKASVYPDSAHEPAMERAFISLSINQYLDSFVEK